MCEKNQSIYKNLKEHIHLNRQKNSRLVGLGNLGDLSTASTVGGVLGTGMIRVELLAHLEDLVGEGVEVNHLAREPGGRLRQIT